MYIPCKILNYIEKVIKFFYFNFFFIIILFYILHIGVLIVKVIEFYGWGLLTWELESIHSEVIMG